MSKDTRMIEAKFSLQDLISPTLLSMDTTTFGQMPSMRISRNAKANSKHVEIKQTGYSLTNITRFESIRERWIDSIVQQARRNSFGVILYASHASWGSHNTHSHVDMFCAHRVSKGSENH